MRLLNAVTLTLEEFVPNKVPLYAILSHTWGEEEVLFDDFQRLTAEMKPTWKNKVQKCCQQAVKDGLKYIWIDTCCIDKSSSAELSETINSMYSWYEKAQVCYTHLEDVSADADPIKPGSSFERCRWFTRGWTLQELIAPSEVIFFSNNWVEVGRKSALYGTLCHITLIDEEILLHKRPVASTSIARRMAWAAHRETTRPEDIAYCLMGLFSVNMPMLYGEGEKAFLRLQEEIMKQSDDQSIFAWVDHDSSPDSLHGLLAPSPSKFAGCADIFPYQDWEPRQPYTMTNRGLQIELPLMRIENNMYVATLDCPSPPDYKNFSFLAIFLRRLSDVDAQYARVNVGTLGEVRERSKTQTIYVRQVHLAPGIHGIFPMHVIQIRTVPEQSIYRVVDVIVANREEKRPPVISSSRGSHTTNLPSRFQQAFSVQKGGISLAALIVLARFEDEQGVVIALGSGTAFDVGFDAFDFSHLEELSLQNFSGRFRASGPKQPGIWIELAEHWVCVKAETEGHNGAKYYLVDIEVNPIPKGRIETIANSLQRRLLAAPDPAFNLVDKSEADSIDKPDPNKSRFIKSKFSFRRMIGA